MPHGWASLSPEFSQGRLHKPKFPDEIQALHKLQKMELLHLDFGNRGISPLNDAVAMRWAGLFALRRTRRAGQSARSGSRTVGPTEGDGKTRSPWGTPVCSSTDLPANRAIGTRFCERRPVPVCRMWDMRLWDTLFCGKV